ncbi:hypothetical protein BV372_17385 [Nostoc sp. T09]|uniref:hypothetical protein n=1 Tax=Nostoc sp. T09 TaxID=1932621 RepID=UPI000A38467C|nr:hypothetical protein [Nostoc sp. T09]OUL33119.1 hypothetical protein BV372_17385 [Nostoc sp. T09]
MAEILRLIEPLSKTQQLGFLALVCLAKRENTTIEHQRDEWNFDDVSREIVSLADGLGDHEQMALVAMIASELGDTDTDDLKEHNHNAQ